MMRRLGLLASAGCILFGSSLVIAAIPSTTATSFEDSVQLTAGLASQAVVIADVDLDGNQDLVVANNESDDVSILYGLGDGTFDAPVNIVTRTGPAAVQVAEMTGDPLPDIVVAHDTASEVLTLKQGPARVFELGTAVVTDDGPTGLVLADFDGDGARDAATANFFSSDGTVSYLRGLGNGDFAEAVNYLTVPPDSELFTGPIALAAADINNDSKNDLVVANSDGNNVALLLGNGDGTFAVPSNFEVGAAPVAIAVGDLNIDGKLDIATADEEDFAVSLLFGQGGGQFETAVSALVGSFPSAIGIWDYNLDGRPDIAVTDSFGENDGVTVLRGGGDGSFLAQEDFVVGGTSPVSIASGDLNGDFKFDVVTANVDAPTEEESLSSLINSGILVVGDALGDGAPVTEGDVTQAAYEMFDGDGSIVIQVAGGVLTSGPGADANGDTFVSAADVVAITAIIAGSGS